MDLERLKIDRAPAGRRRARRRAWPARIGVLAVLAGLAFLFWRDIVHWTERLRLPEVATAPVVRQSALQASAVRGTAANGYVVASRRAALSADTPGRIVEMRVTEGSVVKRGDVVARLYSEEYEALVRRAEAELAALAATRERAAAEVAAQQSEVERLRVAATEVEARGPEERAGVELAASRLERFAELIEQGYETAERLDELETELDQARARATGADAALAAARAAVTTGEAQLGAARARLAEVETRRAVLVAERDQAQATLDKTEVRAPFDGIVVLKDAEVGEVVSPNSQSGGSARGSVVTMVDFESLEVQVDVPETNLSMVAVGAPANVYLDARPEHAYAGRVARVWPTANRQKSTVEVRVTFEERDEFLRPEMGARIVFDPKPFDDSGDPAAAGPETASAVLTIPSQAVVRAGGRALAFVLERDRVAQRELELGPERQGRQIVVAGLSEGERVVLAPPVDLKDGDRVRVASGS